MKAIADNVVEKPVLIKGFKVWGIKVPFTSKPLKTKVVIDLAGIGCELPAPTKDTYPTATSIKIIVKYIATAFTNGRGPLIKWILQRQLLKLSQEELLYLYYQSTILWNPSLFFSLLEEIRGMKGLLIKKEKLDAVTQSGEPSP